MHGNDRLSAEPTKSNPTRGALVNDIYAIHFHCYDRIVSSPDSPSFQPSRSDLNPHTDTGQYQGHSHSNFIATETLASCDSASVPPQLGHHFESSACENHLCSSPPTSSPPLLFSPSSPTSSQSSAIEPLGYSASPKEAHETLSMSERSNLTRSQDQLSVHQTNDSEEGHNVDTYATSESRGPVVMTSHYAVLAPDSHSEPGSSLSDHLNLLPDKPYSSQEIDVDAEFEPVDPSDDAIGPMQPEFSTTLLPQRAHTLVQESASTWLSSDSSPVAGQAVPTDIHRPTSSPQSMLLLSSLPPSSPPSSSPLEDTASPGVENTEAEALRASQEKIDDTSPSLSTLQRDYTMEKMSVSDEQLVVLSKRTPEAPNPEFKHIELPVFDLDSRLILGKRKVENEGVDMSMSQPFKNDDRPALIQDVVSRSTLPNPKRPTIAAQKVQHKKLTTPFRSPVLKRPKSGVGPMKGSTPQAQSLPPAIEERVEQVVPPVTFSAFDTTDTKKKHRTQRAGAQFKSPLSIDASSKLVSSIRMTPTIQALERKLQLLKRALKIKRDGEEEALRALLDKWTEAGREIAWEVWQLVKDNANSEDRGWDRSRSKGNGKPAFEDSWGWTSDEKTARDTERNWGWNVERHDQGTADDVMDETNMAGDIEGTETCRYEDDMDGKKQNTLGTMLMQLGIAPETLGWNEEEGAFQGE